MLHVKATHNTDSVHAAGNTDLGHSLSDGEPH
jgi:hypothetical protein